MGRVFDSYIVWCFDYCANNGESSRKVSNMLIKGEIMKNLLNLAILVTTQVSPFYLTCPTGE